jgi:hypothetical protein
MLRLAFTGELWGDTPDMSWVFVSVPDEVADEIADLIPKRSGFGSVRVEVTVGTETWRTSLFPDSSRGTFVLPVKRAVRTAIKVDVGDRIEVVLDVVDDGVGVSEEDS